jgi:hypothetical protein
MEGTVITTSFEAIPGELPSTFLAVVLDEGLQIFEIFETTGYLDPDLYVDLGCGGRQTLQGRLRAGKGQ